MRLRITRAAEQDLLDGIAFYEKQQRGIGAYFLDSISADIDALALYAGIHAKPHGRFHRTLAKRFPSRSTTKSKATWQPSSPYSIAGATPNRLPRGSASVAS